MKTPIKILTLTFFFGMIALFVAYRGALFSNGKPIPTSPNGGNINANQATSEPARTYDSIPDYVIDSTRLMIMSSSKSMVIDPTPSFMYFWQDSMGVRHYVSRETVYGKSKYGSEIAPETELEKNPFKQDNIKHD